MKQQPVELGSRIKAVRKSRKMSQTELATLLNKSMRTIQKYESGEIEPSLLTINEIASHLNTTPAYLIGYDKNDMQVDTLADVMAFFYQLNEKQELDFEIIEHIPSQDGERACIIKFDAGNRNADSNGTIYNFLKEFQAQRRMLQTYWRDHDDLEAWIDQYCSQYAGSTLTNKTYEQLDEMELVRRRNELDRQMMAAMKKAAEGDGDNEQC